MLIPATNNDFLMLLPFRESRKILHDLDPRCQGIAVKDYGVTLGALLE